MNGKCKEGSALLYMDEIIVIAVVKPIDSGIILLSRTVLDSSKKFLANHISHIYWIIEISEIKRKAHAKRHWIFVVIHYWRQQKLCTHRWQKMTFTALSLLKIHVTYDNLTNCHTEYFGFGVLGVFWGFVSFLSFFFFGEGGGKFFFVFHSSKSKDLLFVSSMAWRASSLSLKWTKA